MTLLDRAPLAAPGIGDAPRPAGRRPRARLGRFLWSRPGLVLAVAVVLLALTAAFVPSLLAPGDPAVGDTARRLAPPGPGHWFGTDHLGRDVWTRVVHGASLSLQATVVAVAVALVAGGLIGLLAGFAGGWVDSLLARVADVFFGVPFILGAIVVLSTFRASVGQSVIGISGLVIGTIGLLSWPIVMRIMRSAAIAARNQDYVKAARALGASPWRIIRRHMLPNTIAPVMVYATIALGAFIGAEATLSFLGVGLRDPVVSWGVMISEAQSYLRTSPHLLLFPGAFLVVTVLAFVLLGDAVRDAFDPKGRS